MERPTPRQARLRQIAVGAAVGLVFSLLAGSAIGAGVANLATASLTFAARPFIPSFEALDALAATSKVVADDGTILAELDRGEHREPVAIDDLPDHVVRAVLAAEDQDFYGHQGFDISALGRAIVRTASGNVQGGSTITQQLAKLNYTGSERSIARKLREALYAISLEHQLGKDELLERYLNQVYFGEGAHGIATAAATFFGVDAPDLSPAQAATLAGKIKAPEALDPFAEPDAVTARRNQVLDLMAARDWLTADEAEAAKTEPLGVKEPDAGDDSPVKAPYFVELVKREAMGIDELGGSEEARRRRLLTGGLTIETTLDADAQVAAEQAVAARLPGPNDPAVGIVTVVPGDGAVKVLLGGVDFARQQFDTATQAERQPGSAFKPFVYLAAVGKGIHPDSQLEGTSPTRFDTGGGSYEVRNYGDRDFAGLKMSDALVNSVNTAFVDLILEIGPPQAVRTAHKAGVQADIAPHPSTALGGISPGVTPLEMANAFATFGAAGERAEPYAIARIKDADGEVIFERTPSVERAFPEEEVGVLNAGLKEVVRQGTGRAAAFGRDVGGKTGTTTDNRDAWFVGTTAQRATAVWLGHLDNSPLPGLTGGSLPAELFAQVMTAAHEGLKQLPLYTADPDDLSLNLLEPTTTTNPTTSSTSSTTTSSTTSAPATTERPNTTRQTTTTQKKTTTTQKKTTTTTTQPPSTTTTTAPTDSTDGGGSDSDDTTTSSSGTSSTGSTEP